MIGVLWSERKRYTLFSRAWAKAWCKRSLQAADLVKMEWRLRRLVAKGAKIGSLSVVAPLQIIGRVALMSIGERCAIGRVHFQLHDQVTIGNCVVINDGVHIMTGTHDINSPGWDFRAAPVRIGDYAWVATGATLLPGVTVGEGAVVGAFAVVPKSVEPYTVVAGNPARVVSHRVRQPFSYWPAEGFATLRAWLG